MGLLRGLAGSCRFVNEVGNLCQMSVKGQISDLRLPQLYVCQVAFFSYTCSSMTVEVHHLRCSGCGISSSLHCAVPLASGQESYSQLDHYAILVPRAAPDLCALI